MTDAPTPNLDVIRRWVAALRSGDYVQGTGYLHEVVDGRSFYCCLGVLCDLALREGVVERTRRPIGSGLAHEHACYHYGLGNDRAEGVLPPPVIRWAGLGNVDDYDGFDGDDPVVEGVALTSWNDGALECGRAPRSFAEIADALERTYLSPPPPPPDGES